MIHLLSSLIGFGFYDDVSKLKDVLIPLVLAANAHRKRTHKTVTNPGSNATLPKNAAAGATQDFMLPDKLVMRQDMQKAIPQSSPNHTKSAEVYFDDDDEVPETYDEAINIATSTANPVARSLVTKIYTKLSRFWSKLRSIRSHEEFENENEELKWYEKWYIITGRMDYLTIILIAVFGCVVVVFLELLISSGNEIGYRIFDLAVTIFFGIEVALRLYCFVRVKSKFWSFFKDRFNGMDISLVVLDVIVLSVEAYYGGQDASLNQAASLTRGIKALRAIRFLRLLRILRAARLLKRMTEV